MEKLKKAGVEKTGQTNMYQAGDDGDLQEGITWPNPRFDDNGDGTVLDNLTGLTWLKDAHALGAVTWGSALRRVADLITGTDFSADGYTAGTYDDWRLPNIKELQSLIDFSRYAPALPDGHLFTGINTDLHKIFWSSTTFGEFIDEAWYVNIQRGRVDAENKTADFSVWPVRGRLRSFKSKKSGGHP